jgi:hypothetical protein
MKVLFFLLAISVIFLSFANDDLKTQELDMKGKWGLGCNFQYSWPKFEAVNSYYEDVDNLFVTYWDSEEQEFKFDNLSGISGDVRYGILNNVVIGLGLKTLSQDQTLTYSGVGIVDEALTFFTRMEDWTIKAVPIQLTLYYYSAWGPFQYFVGAGGSYYSCNAEVITKTTTDEGRIIYQYAIENMYPLGKTYWEGSGIGVHGKLGIEYFLNSFLALGVEGAYNYAVVDELTDFNAEPFAFFEVSEGVGFIKDDEPVEFDLSGFDISMGLRLYF